MDGNSVTHSIVDSTESVVHLIYTIQTLPSNLKSLFLDLEGVSLSRHGSISLMTIFIPSKKHVYLVDVHALQSSAFSTATDDGTTLKTILESPTITKVFFDKAVKEAGLKLYHPKKGGSYEVFNIRPLPTPIKAYCINDVQYLPQLRERFWQSLNGDWREKVRVETRKRVSESQSKSYDPQSDKKKYSPWEKLYV
ncbi:hypothetical protein CSUB01_11626 [Colletotrichum sublineola]|uniref:3'-5' exonuclease domain-containing protein n=1 Tax=Colletotrichum sublineola TaxID=1173701 RepID=A0A066XIA9_COLSU|nr:hypothetical protein CSUB01_11626 [Colletotrichum sublineola]